MAERSWNHHAGRAAAGLGQSVAGGQIDEVTARLRNRLDDAAPNAFTTGMRTGLALAAVGLVVGSGLDPGRSPADGAGARAGRRCAIGGRLNPALPAVLYFPPPAARCTADLIALVMTLPIP